VATHSGPILAPYTPGQAESIVFLSHPISALVSVRTISSVALAYQSMVFIHLRRSYTFLRSGLVDLFLNFTGFKMVRFVTLAASIGPLLPFSAYATPLDKRAALDTCLSTAGVPIFTSGSGDYTQALKPFNLRVTFKPAAYAVPVTVKHVQDAVACGAANNVRVTAKSGGHSYASHGLGGEDGHLIVDMRNFKDVVVDQTAKTAVIGTGGRLGDVATALYKQGKQAMSHGTCPGYIFFLIMVLYLTYVLAVLVSVVSPYTAATVSSLAPKA